MAMTIRRSLSASAVSLAAVVAVLLAAPAIAIRSDPGKEPGTPTFSADYVRVYDNCLGKIRWPLRYSQYHGMWRFDDTGSLSFDGLTYYTRYGESPETSDTIHEENGGGIISTPPEPFHPAFLPGKRERILRSMDGWSFAGAGAILTRPTWIFTRSDTVPTSTHCAHRTGVTTATIPLTARIELDALTSVPLGYRETIGKGRTVVMTDYLATTYSDIAPANVSFYRLRS